MADAFSVLVVPGVVDFGVPVLQGTHAKRARLFTAHETSAYQTGRNSALLYIASSGNTTSHTCPPYVQTPQRLQMSSSSFAIKQARQHYASTPAVLPKPPVKSTPISSIIHV